ncbi:MAG TPA: reactive intermediate/imine deaminase, partial [Firmicutes bacterium]|nr:reactive intermediate/imine deaminase [Bacillota bacterium]
RKIVHTEKAPAAVGPYNQGIRAGNLLFISGQLGVDMSTGEIA